MKIKVKRLYPNAELPKYATPGDAGADLFLLETVYLRPGERILAKTGIAVEIPKGFVGLVHPRSGLANKHGVTVTNAPGTIDSGYRGEIMVNLINHGKSAVEFARGYRIAQLVIQEVPEVEFELVEELNDSERGENGHGSTGG